MSAAPTLSAERREGLLSCRNEFTCYSAAIATWLATEREDWARLVNPGLWLTITEAGDGVFGFAYFPAQLRAELGLVRAGADEVGAAIEGVRQELARSGRVIVAGDGFHLPWHVAAGRVHVPHWFVLLEGADGLEVFDPFACRNELGIQEATRLPVAADALSNLLPALPGHDPIHVLRERLAFGDQTEPCELGHQWFVCSEVGDWHRPVGADGPDALLRLAGHFRAHGQDPGAYAQADDIWSIARHRAFLHRWATARATQDGDDALTGWVADHATPLTKRWGHIAPLLMQATLALGVGRTASTSVPDTLERLATLEQAASDALIENSFSI